MAGLLHDVVEDTTVTLEEIAERFGADVAGIVAACSEDKQLSWEERKAHTLETLPDAPFAVKLVACADKLHNIRDLRMDYERLGDRVWDRFKRGRDKQAWYYRGLAAAFAREIEEGIYPSLFRAFATSLPDQLLNECKVAGVTRMVNFAWAVEDDEGSRLGAHAGPVVPGRRLHARTGQQRRRLG